MALHSSGGKALVTSQPISTHVLLNLLVCDGRFQGGLAGRGSRLRLSGQCPEKEEEILSGIDLLLILWYIAVVAHRALAPRSQISAGGIPEP